jgi:Fic family protein
MWIHERATWPRFIWDANAIGPALADVRHRQGLLLGRMGALGFDLRQEAGLETLTQDVVRSAAIEGEQFAPEDVRSSIARRLGLDVGGTEPVSRDVEGMVEVLLDATGNAAAPLTAERLFSWHAALFPAGRSGMQRIAVGAWRAGPMDVVSGPLGREAVHFTAPEPERLGAEMAMFLERFAKGEQDPVLKAAIAHVWFVTIHPFDDGNGRIARAIADMALARGDRAAQRFYSLSAQIEAERKAYYTELERAQRGDMDITPWISWFLGCLGRAIAGSEDRLEKVLAKARFWERANAAGVNDRQRLILNRMLDDFRGHMRSSKYAALAKCSPDTALRDIQDLVSKGLLTQNPGGGRSTSYGLGDEAAPYLGQGQTHKDA